MKRYWKTISLIILIIVTFSILYIDNAVAKDDLPELELVTVSGDEKIADSLLLYGNYWLGSDLVNSFKLSDEGMNYIRNASFLERLNGYYRHPTMERIIQENHQFMRGKGDFLELLFEDESVLAWVGPYMSSEHNKEWDVEILEKESGDKQGFSVEIPELEKVTLMSVEDVQLIDGKIYVITHNNYVDWQDVHVYEIDLQQERIDHNYSMLEVDADNYITNLHPYFDISPQNNWVMRIDQLKWDDALQHDEIVHKEIIMHDLKAGETETLELPEEWKNTSESNPEIPMPDGNFSVGQEKIYYFYFSSEGLTCQSYNLQDRQLGEAVTIPLGEKVIVEGVYPLGDQLYVIQNKPDDAKYVKKVIGIDLEKADTFYEGEIRLKNESASKIANRFDIYELYAY